MERRVSPVNSAASMQSFLQSRRSANSGSSGSITSLDNNDGSGRAGGIFQRVMSSRDDVILRRRELRASPSGGLGFGLNLGGGSGGLGGGWGGSLGAYFQADPDSPQRTSLLTTILFVIALLLLIWVVLPNEEYAKQHHYRHGDIPASDRRQLEGAGNATAGTTGLPGGISGSTLAANQSAGKMAWAWASMSKNRHGKAMGHKQRSRYAYVTLLCDDVMAEAAMVMVHSVLRTGTKNDMVILTLNVSNQTLEHLVTLGARIEPIIDPVPYPFAVTADRLAINKPCRYSKLLMWKMIHYTKLVYLDSDLLILRSIDDLFERPQLAACPDTLPPDKFNSGLMVVEPNKATFQDMLGKIATTLSPNVGDQGFLNSYFADWYKQDASHRLDYTYNALIRISSSPGWKHFIEPNLKVLHFSGGTKPWNTMVDKQFPTTRAFDFIWWDVYDEVYSILHENALKKKGPIKLAPATPPPPNTTTTAIVTSATGTAAADEANRRVMKSDGGGLGDGEKSEGGDGGSGNAVAPTPPPPGNTWKALPVWEGPPQLHPQCNRNYPAYARGHIVTNKFSVVMNCFDRFDLMLYFVRRYASFDFVHKIYIVWGNTKITPFEESYFNVTKRVEILYSGIDSLNDRFKPIKSLETEAILLCDDDIEVTENGLRIGFERWQEDKYRLVGYFPRAHYREVNGPRAGHMTYVLTPRQEYSIVLTKMFFTHADYLRAYTCSMPQKVRDYVDKNKNCEDIAMNFIVTQLSGLPPLLVEDPAKLDYGTSSGLSSRGTHDLSRSVCTQHIVDMLGYMSLRNSSEATTFFERDKMVKVVRRRQLSTSAHMDFSPVFDSFEHSSSRQFLKQLAFQTPLITNEIAQVPTQSVNRHILCLKGDNVDDANDASHNQYTLLDFASVPPDVTHLSGTTFVVNSQYGYGSRFALLHLVASLATWRRNHGCFGPARVILYHDGLLVTELSAWASNLFKAVLGPGGSMPFKPPSDQAPQCLEQAVVLRQRDTVNVDDCSANAREIGRVVQAFCRAQTKRQWSNSVLADPANAEKGKEETPVVRVAFVGDVDNWEHMAWFNYTLAATWIKQECAVIGLKCQVAMVQRGDFCNVKVLGLGRADIVIGPWGDRALDSIILFKEGTAVLELHPTSTHTDDLKAAKSEAECLHLSYEQMHAESTMKDLLLWVSRHLETLSRDPTARKLEAEPTYLESCVRRSLRY